MISQSAAPAAPAAAAGANPAAVLTGGDTLPADLLTALFAASGPPFAATLQALHAPTTGATAEANAKAGAPAAAGAAVPAELLVAQLNATASPVPQPLQALQGAVSGTPSGGRNDSTPTTPTTPTAPTALTALTAPGGAAPAQLLLAKYAAGTGALQQHLPVQVPDGAGAGARRAGAAGRTAKAASAATEATTGASASGNTPLLALVLQWLQQQGGDAPRGISAPGSTDGSRPEAGAGVGDDAGSAGIAMVGAAAGLSVPGAQQTEGARTRTDRDGVAPANASAGTAANGDLAAAARLPAVASALQVLPDAPRLPPEPSADRQPPGTHDAPGSGAGVAAPSADANGAIANMDLAAALRAATVASPSSMEHSIAVPVHDRHWPQALAAQVLILSNDRIQAATLRLSPEHLGPVDVHIDLSNSQVNVTFSAAHVETRAALEQALPQLRAVLAGAGLALGQATVQQQARGESQNPSGTEQLVSAALDRPESMVTVAHRLGLVDEYV